MAKSYCSTYLMKKEKCGDCEELLPKYTTDGNKILFTYCVLLIFIITYYV